MRVGGGIPRWKTNAMKSVEARFRHFVKPERALVLPENARTQWLGGISESTEHRLRQTDPDFPKRVEASPGRTAYVADELDSYVALKIAQRDAGATPAVVLSGRRLGKSGLGGRPPGKARKERQVAPAE
jgi:predicted DNA-binding transcriptional regulator AlpA